MTTSFSQPLSARRTPISRNSPTQVMRGRHYGISRSSNNSPLTVPTEPHVPHSLSTSSAYGHGFPYYDDPGSPIIMDTRPQTGIVHGSSRSRSSRMPLRSAYSLERDPMERDPYLMRDSVRDPRDRSLDRLVDMAPRHPKTRDRSLDRSVYLRDDPMAYRDRETMIDDPYRDQIQRPLSHTVGMGDPRHNYSRDSFIMELQARLNELQNQYGHVKRELDATTQKLGSSMHSIKTFWSPELKKERALRKEEAAKYALLNDQLKILRSENQVCSHFSPRRLRPKPLKAAPESELHCSLRCSRRPLLTSVNVFAFIIYAFHALM
ncbi:ERC protein 2-like protein [Dinothrombium tinctorium]|uniref:ERC protein 2-like protein n=1 Tax=Dinothrombium tinctorium TaxID=1965070 RepID=A0A443RRG4_9ACAR|nr:ERC protein 2-like protein [Dinothrombium tinctorium]